MTTRLIADSEHMDHVTILLARVCAARLDTTIAAEEFVRMVARLVDVAVAEAIEDAEPIWRLKEADRIGDRVRALASGLDPVPPQTRCVYCHNVVLPSAEKHECERMRELGLVPPKANGTDALLRDLGVVDEKRSTGAADGDSRADHHDARAASEPAAAPSTVAAPAPSQPPTSLSEPAADGAGTSPAGPRPGAEASQPRKRHRNWADPQKIDELRRRYDAALRDNGGKLPYGWLKKQLEATGLSYSTVWSYVRAFKSEPARSAPASNREHTRSNACWCRKSTNTAANRWCSNKPGDGKPVGLRSRVPPTVRNERFTGERARASAADID